MASWSEVEAAAPDLAARVRARFEAHGLGLLATIRRNGTPRISGVEPVFGDELWLGMMPNSRKAQDLMRNPRLGCHSATADKNVTDGDAKLSGRGILVEDEQTLRSYRGLFKKEAGYEPPPEPMHLFRVEVTEISMLRVEGDHLLIEFWKEGSGVRAVRRR